MVICIGMIRYGTVQYYTGDMRYNTVRYGAVYIGGYDMVRYGTTRGGGGGKHTGPPETNMT